MKSASIIAVLQLTSVVTSFSADSWVASVATGRASIEYSAHSIPGEHAHATLDRALRELAAHDRVLALREISARDLLQDQVFQRELFSALEAEAPGELHEALSLTGGARPPKMARLWKPFERAVLATPTIRKVNSRLDAFGLQVSGISFEQLEIKHGGDGPRFTAAKVSLMVGPIFKPAQSRVPYK
jgi:hypothetical protein